MISIFRESVDYSKYFICAYHLKSTISLYDAAWQIAIGQSVGNPNVRSKWETDELLERHACMVITQDENELKSKQEGIVNIAFPTANISIENDGVSQLLCQVMGGQMDIDSILVCRLKKIWYPESIAALFYRPKYGLSGMRNFTGCIDKPLLGAIIKPKIGITPDALYDIVSELIDGGVNFIKEDEIMSSPPGNSVDRRITRISNLIHDNKVVYSACINADPQYILYRARNLVNMGANGIHANVWCGLGVYKSLRELDLPLFLHFQKSGDRVFTAPEHRFGIDWSVICELAALMGVDTIHVGMLGGYKSDDPTHLKEIIKGLTNLNVVPALSCGMHPGLVDNIRNELGNDWMASAGGAIHGHPEGTKAGALAMKQAIDQTHNHEYEVAIEVWGQK